MTTKDKVARRKLSLLQLAQELDNVSKACKIIGYSRQQFYEIRRNYQTYGAQDLVDRLPGPKGPHPNRVAKEIEKAILDYNLDHPSRLLAGISTTCPKRCSSELWRSQRSVEQAQTFGVPPASASPENKGSKNKTETDR